LSKLASKGTRYWLDHRNLSGSLNAVDMDLTQETPDATCFEDNGPRVVIGNYGHSHNLRGLFDGSSSNIDAASDTLIGSTATGHYLAELFGGTAEGSVCYESIVHGAGKPISVATGQAIVQEIPLAGAGGLARSHILGNGTVASTTGLLTSVDQGATTGGTYQAVFRAFSGTFTNCVLQVEESSNNSTWGIGSTALAAIFTEPGVSRVTTTAATLQYKRVTATTFVGTDVVVGITGGLVAGSLPPAT
jgi:hypothetical protein